MKTNQVLDLLTHVKAKFCQFAMKYMPPLICYPMLEVRGVFLDISKAFDRVWYEGLIYKIKSVGLSDPLLKLIESFLSNRY